MSPGNNYQITASLDADSLGEVTQPMIDDSDHFDMTEGVYLSNMLTVWRKLHIEFDTMEAPPASKHFGAFELSVHEVAPDHVRRTSWDPTADQFELNGAVLDPKNEIHPPSNYVNYKNVLIMGPQTFEIDQQTPGTALLNVLTDYSEDRFDSDGDGDYEDDNDEIYYMTPNSAGGTIGINTDDPLWSPVEAPGTLSPPNHADIIEGMNNYYNRAYIKVEEQTQGNTNPTFPFVRRTKYQLASADVPGDNLYWCVCVGWAYEQWKLKEPWPYCDDNCPHSCYTGDDDPEFEGVPPGYSWSIQGEASGIYEHPVLGDDCEKCMIFCENIRDTDRYDKADNTVSHEVGHCLGLTHAKYEGDFLPEKDGIMGWYREPWNFYPCDKQWGDLLGSHESPEMFSEEDILFLRESAGD